MVRSTSRVRQNRISFHHQMCIMIGKEVGHCISQRKHDATAPQDANANTMQQRKMPTQTQRSNAATQADAMTREAWSARPYVIKIRWSSDVSGGREVGKTQCERRQSFAKPIERRAENIRTIDNRVCQASRMEL